MEKYDVLRHYLRYILLFFSVQSEKDPRYKISPYPTYHSAYDTFDYVER